MSLRGKTAIVGIGEIPTRRSYPGRSLAGLCAEAARLAIEDAGLRKEDIDGLVLEGSTLMPATMAEYLGIRPTYCTGVSMQGASGTSCITAAGAALAAGLCNYVLIVIGQAREGDPGLRGFGGPSIEGEFEGPFGPAQGAGTGYAMMYTRHMYEFGTKPEQLAKMAADQRFNALLNPNAVFQGQPITPEDVLNSRYIHYPLHILECVMPCAGAGALIMTTAERAKSFPHRPVYLLGAGMEQGVRVPWLNPRLTTTPARVAAAKAYTMAQYGAKDVQFAEFYDCYTILAAMSLEDAGICKKGEIGPFYESTDTTYKGAFPINTDGGQLSAGQPGPGGGLRHVIEAARQIMGRADERQVRKSDLCLVNG